MVPSRTDADGTVHKGGISTFVVEMDSPGITVENRNAFMGLRGIENGVTRFHQVRVPAANRLGREGQGLKIALTTLNTGRLSIPGLCVGSGRWSLKIAREWSNARVQWGRPVGMHEAVGKKIAFIAASAFALDAVFELCAEMADAGQKDVRIEAALAKLWCTEISCRIADELVQIRGGRGFETADSLEARGERAVPAEQQLRDLRINRIFEGSSEIMKLLIAREAVDAHLAAAGDLASEDASLSDKARAAVGASGFYAKWLPKLVAGAGMDPRSYSDFGRLARQLRFVERSSRRLARQTFYGMGRWQAKLEHKQAFLGRIVDIGAELFAMAACCSRAEMLLRTAPGDRAPPPTSSPRRTASRPGCAWTSTSTSSGGTLTTATTCSSATSWPATTSGSRPGYWTSQRAPGRGLPMPVPAPRSRRTCTGSTADKGRRPSGAVNRIVSILATFCRPWLGGRETRTPVSALRCPAQTMGPGQSVKVSIPHEQPSRPRRSHSPTRR